MANKIFLCLLLVCLTVNFIECKCRSSSKSRGDSNRPSFRTNSRNSGRTSSRRPSSSSEVVRSRNTNSMKTPSRSSGSSRFHTTRSPGSRYSSYESAVKYPSSSGMSGSEKVYKHPSSPSRQASVPVTTKYTTLLHTTGSSGVHKYPTPTDGLSGTVVQHPNIQPSGGYDLNINKNNYNPPHVTVYHPSNTFNNNSGYGSGTHNPGFHLPYSYPPTYYSSPQYVYITKYRNSGSRYSDILTGLALYNLGRSDNQHHDHYYYDDYDHHHLGSNYRSNDQKKKVAVCTLKIKENGKIEILKIPCAIVSTFSDNTTATAIAKQNSTVCVMNTTVVNSTLPTLSNTSAANSTATASNVTITSSTSCTSVVNATEPLQLKGPPLNTTGNIECSVEINTKETRFVKKVDCKTLMEYSKIPEPKRETVERKKDTTMTIKISV